VIWIDGIGYVVFPLDGINGAHPAFIGEAINDRGRRTDGVSAQSGEVQ
jgi:hypothetical protein